MSIILETILINAVYLLFPISVYLVYIAYIRNMDLEEKKIFFDLAVFSSAYFTIRYGIDFDYIIPLVLLNIPLLLCYLKRNYSSSIVLSLICMTYCYQIVKIPVFVLFVEYFVYFVFYHYVIKKRLTPPRIICYFIIIVNYNASC